MEEKNNPTSAPKPSAGKAASKATPAPGKDAPAASAPSKAAPATDKATSAPGKDAPAPPAAPTTTSPSAPSKAASKAAPATDKAAPAPSKAAPKAAPATTAAPAAPAASAAPKVAPARQIVFDSNEDRFSVAEQAIADPDVLHQLVENLSTDMRRMRQFSAGAISVLADSHPELLVAHASQLIDALYRPEAQTRWESLEVLARVAPLLSELPEAAIVGAEASLYDEDNGTARLSAVRFLAAYGGLGAKQSLRVWPLLDEAIQCYHGDAEFQDMLIAVIGFASGDLDKDVKKALADRVRFDAQNGRGPLRRRTAQILALCSA